MTGDWLSLLPQFVLFAGGVMIVVGARWLPRPSVWGAVAVAVVLGAAACLFQAGGFQDVAEAASFGSGSGVSVAGSFGYAANVAFLFAGAVLVLGAWTPQSRGETHGLLLCGVACAMLAASVDALIPLFLMLELCAFAATALCAVGEPGASAIGVARHTIMLQLASAGLLLVAVLLVRFDQGTTDLPELRTKMAEAVQSRAETGMNPGPSRAGRAAFVLLFAAVAVQAFLVPFHFGSPEFLTRSPTTACSYALTVSRGAALVVLFRVGMLAFAGFESPGLVVSAVLSGGTMLIGTALAVGRERLRETLSYLLIGQGGAVLFGLSIAWGRATAAPADAVPSFLTRGETAAGLTLLSVSLSVLGLFAVLNHLRAGERPVEYVEELTGLLRERPLVAAALAVLLLNLVGVPPLPGFWARLVTVISAFSVTKEPADVFPTPHPAFLILAAAMGIQILITAGVLFRIVAVMIFAPPVARSRAAGGLPSLLAGVVCAAILVAAGFMPSRTIATLNTVIPQPHEASASPSTSSGSSPSAMRDER